MQILGEALSRASFDVPVDGGHRMVGQSWLPANDERSPGSERCVESTDYRLPAGKLSTAESSARRPGARLTITPRPPAPVAFDDRSVRLVMPAACSSTRLRPALGAGSSAPRSRMWPRRRRARGRLPRGSGTRREPTLAGRGSGGVRQLPPASTWRCTESTLSCIDISLSRRSSSLRIE